jgi:hypothetical protein
MCLALPARELLRMQLAQRELLHKTTGKPENHLLTERPTTLIYGG